MCTAAAASISLSHTHSPTASTERKNVIVFSPRAHGCCAARSREMSTTLPPIEIENKPSRIAENESLRQTLIATPAPPSDGVLAE
jgi:hypothetical protein